MVRSGPGRSGPVGLRSDSVLNGIIFGFLVRADRTGPDRTDRTEDRIGTKPRISDRTEIRSVWSSFPKTSNVPVSIPDLLCLKGLTLHHGNNVFDCIVWVKGMGVNILKSIDEGPFRMGTLRETLTEGTEGALHLGPERPRVYSNLTSKDKDSIGHLARNCTQPKRPQNSKYFIDKMLLMQAQETGVALDEEQLLFITGGQDNVVDEAVDEQPVKDLALNVDNVFQADDYDAFDSDVDEAPTAQTLFMANLSSADPVYDEAGLSYDSDVLSEVRYHDHNQDAVCEHHEVHVMHDDVQPNYVVDLHNDYTSDSNMILYDQYVKDNAVKVAIDYKSPLCLARAKQVQPALYNGHEIIKTDHVPAIVYNSKDTLEIAEITRKKINEKMKTPMWTHNKINIRPPDYSKENFLATFTPQTQLTPEQIFWSKDVLEMKIKALKEQAKAAKAVKALMMYPLNTHEFEKTRKKRITPTGFTEGERGFEHTKECYLTKVIPIFKTLKEHFEGIKKALTIKIKEIKTIFDELKAEVDQDAVNRKCDEIERKNLLIANDTLIANCLSKEVFYIATNFKLNVSRFSEMHDARTVVHARCCSKHMTGDRSRLKNFVKKFIETVRFRNDYFGAIMGYGVYVIGDSVISRVKFLRLKDETLEVVIKFLKQIQVGLNKTVRFIRTDNGTEFVNHDLTHYYESVSIFHQKSVLRTPQQNAIVERRNRTLVKAARTMLIFSKALMFHWAESVATACYTQNRSLIHTRHKKTACELMHNKKPDLTFLCIFGALCYLTNDSKGLGKLQPTANIGIFVGYAPSRKGYKIYNKRTRRIMKTIHVQFNELSEPMAPVQLSTGPTPTFLTPGQISLGLVPNMIPVAPYVPLTNKELEILFQPMFDEYLEPPYIDRMASSTLAVPTPVNSADTPSSTFID
nr:retrovirus-related Pol polyprotein from transposon TNT 1-94 [Tanacetum cinerariifolium]